MTKLRLGLAIGLALCALTTAGCTKPKTNGTAVFLDDGHPTVITLPCDKAATDHVAVLEDPPSTATPTPTDSAEPSGTLDQMPIWSYRGAPVKQVRLLEAPTGWIRQSNPPAVPLAEFTEDHAYSVLAADHVGITFTIADLRGLAADQVWAAPKLFADETAMPRAEFCRRKTR